MSAMQTALEIRTLAHFVALKGIASVVVARDISLARRASRRCAEAIAFLEQAISDWDQEWHDEQIRKADLDTAHVVTRELMISRAESAYLRCDYRRAMSSWAGGEHNTRVTVADRADADGRSERVWSKNGKWSGTNSIAIIKLGTQYAWLDQRDLGVIRVGKRRHMTIDYHPATRTVTYVTQGRGFTLNTAKISLDQLLIHTECEALAEMCRACGCGR